MPDQADRLRKLAGAATARGGERSPSVDLASAPDGAQPECCGDAHSFLFTSGKGGVGTSNVVLNLGIALGEMGERVVVVDADIGLANLDLLCGFYPRYDLGDVLLGRCKLSGAMAPGPGGIQVVAGVHASRVSMSDLGAAAERLASELGELSVGFDFVLIDAGSGLSPGAGMLAAAVDQAVVVTTPEPTSVADAHAAISRFHQSGISRLRVLINQAASGAEAERVLEAIVSASRQFNGAVVSPLGPRVCAGRSTGADRGSEPATVRISLSGICCFAKCATNRSGRLQGAASAAANATAGLSSGACRSVVVMIGRQLR